MIKTIPLKISLCHVDDEKYMNDTTKMKVFDYIECTEVALVASLIARILAKHVTVMLDNLGTI
jgi:hypothetical protein